MNWKNITLKQWEELDRLSKQKFDDDILYTSEIIKAVFNIDDPLSMTPQEFQKYVGELSFMKDPIPEAKLCNSYNINGTKYNFKGNIYEITMGALMDWRKYSTEQEIDYAQCLSVFMIPEGCKYNEGYDIDKAIEDIRCLPITDVLKVYTFFQTALKLSMEILIDYFQRLMKKTKLTKEQRVEVQNKIKQAQEILDMTSYHTLSAMQK